MCKLQEVLEKLKKSSVESVDNEKNFSEFKEYMHVERVVQKDLEHVIELAKTSSKKSLVLVCGNVGDGKSHLISYLKNKKKILDEFIIHNDATESYGRNQTEKQALSKVLSEFNDENINNGSNVKIIVAINLGILSNFIYSEEGKDFSVFKSYVEDNRILTDNRMANIINNEFISHVNFGDYHLYRLKNDGVDSPYISSIIDKVTSNDPNNVFYKGYEFCSSCPKAKYCPVKLNFEMLGDNNVKNGVIDVLLETIIKDKLIISTRELLNFIYDIIVHPNFDSNKEFKKFDADYTLPNILFTHEDISDLLYRIKKYDLINIRGEENDALVTKFYNTKDIKKIYTEYICDNICLSMLKDLDLNSFNKEQYLLYFLRLMRLCSKNDSQILRKDYYLNFIKDLFSYNMTQYKDLKDLYRTVKNCVYAWTGSGDKTNILLDIIDDKYCISTPLKISANNIISDDNIIYEDKIDKFSDNIVLSFKTEFSNEESVELTIDYELYEMLIMINSGYTLTAKDKNYYATFLTFVNKLIAKSRFNSEIFITNLNSKTNKKYKFFDSEFGMEFVEV